MFSEIAQFSTVGMVTTTAPTTFARIDGGGCACSRSINDGCLRMPRRTTGTDRCVWQGHPIRTAHSPTMDRYACYRRIAVIKRLTSVFRQVPRFSTLSFECTTYRVTPRLGFGLNTRGWLAEGRNILSARVYSTNGVIFPAWDIW